LGTDEPPGVEFLQRYCPRVTTAIEHLCSWIA
jgi:hypothetical protein